jgi:protein-disulfide isomerase
MLKRKIEEDFDSGVRSGVVGTPTFFINGQRYNGSCDEHSLSLFIKIEIQELSRK